MTNRSWIGKALAVALFVGTIGQTTTTQAEVYSGTTDVTKDGEEHKALDAAAEDTQELSVQAGALVAGGNARSTAATGMIRYLLRRKKHELSAVAAVNYARASQENDAGEDIGMETTVENYQGRVRYDYFWTKRFSSFLAVQGRRDRFQGLNLRLGVDPGVTYYFLRKDKHLFWGEVGYDFQYDILTQETLDLAEAEGAPRDRTETDHNARAFLGYDLKAGERLAFLAGLEFFKSFINGPSYRVNFNAELQTKLVENLSFAVGSTTMYNNTPLPGVKKLDVTTSINLMYSFF